MTGYPTAKAEIHQPTCTESASDPIGRSGVPFQCRLTHQSAGAFYSSAMLWGMLIRKRESIARLSDEGR